MFNLHIRSRNTSQAEMLTITLRKFIFWRKKKGIQCFPLWCIFNKCLANWHGARPMDSCHDNPSPSDPMDPICRHFPLPPKLNLAVYHFLLRVSLAVDGLRRSDSVWVYWTTLPILVFFRTWTTSLRFCPWSREKGDEMEDVTYESEVLNPNFFWFQTLSYIFS